MCVGKRLRYADFVAIRIVVVLMFAVAVLVSHSTPANAQNKRNDDGCPVEQIEFGEAITGIWSPGECDSFTYQSIESEDGKRTRADFYYFEVVETSFVEITIASDWLTLMTLYDSSWGIYAESNYDSGASLNTQLTPQVYYLEVMVDEAYLPAETEEYALGVSILGADECLTNEKQDDILSVLGRDSREGCETNLLGHFNPLVGGIDILSDDGTDSDEALGGCTLGFYANLIVGNDPPVRGIVTNSHCTLKRGEYDETRFYQGDWDNRITSVAGEYLDSPLYDTRTPLVHYNSPNDKAKCRPISDNGECQYSDAAFFKLKSGINAEFRIARPQGINTLTPAESVLTSPESYRQHLRINTGNPYFEIVGVDTVERGDRVYKVGATTGWTAGTVTSICEDHGVSKGWKGALLCQVEWASSGDAVVSGNGDSGSPVFKCVNAAGDEDIACAAGLVVLLGIHHSGDPEELCDAEERCYDLSGNFSPIASVLGEFNKALFGLEQVVCVDAEGESDCGPEPIGAGETICWVVDSGGDCGGTISRPPEPARARPPRNIQRQVPMQEDMPQEEVSQMDAFLQMGAVNDCAIQPLDSGNDYSGAWGECTSMSNGTDLNFVQDAQFASYSFTLLDSATVNIALMPTTSTTWVTGVYLYDSNWGGLASEESQGTDGASSLEFELAAGGYFVEVIGINRSIDENPPATFMLTIQAGGALKQAPEEPSVPTPSPPELPPPPELPIPEAPEASIEWNRVIAGTVAVVGLVLIVRGALTLRTRRVRTFSDGGRPDMSTKEVERLLAKAHRILKNEHSYAPNHKLIAYIAKYYFVEIQFTKKGPIGRHINPGA